MNSIKSMITKSLYALLIAGLNSVCWAQEPASIVDKNDPSQVIAYQGEAILTQQELDAAFMQIPEHSRLPFIRDGARVDQLVRGLLEIKMLKQDAVAHGLTDDPLVNTTVAMAAEKELARLWSQRIPFMAPEADFTAMAKEDYLANPSKYDKSASIDLTQILINTEERSQEEAQKIAMQLKEQLNQNPERFQRLLAEYSDDDSKLTTFGQIKDVRKGQMVPEFERVAFALQVVGEISDPVTTEYGVHLIRLDAQHRSGIPPFEAVQKEAIETQKSEYQQRYLRKYFSQLFSAPAVFPEGSVEIMVKRYFGENLENAPIYSESLED